MKLCITAALPRLVLRSSQELLEKVEKCEYIIIDFVHVITVSVSCLINLRNTIFI